MIRFTVALIALIAFSFPAQAKYRHHYRYHHHYRHIDRTPVFASQHEQRKPLRSSRVRYSRRSHRINTNMHDPRPYAWCGWQMRQWLGVADRAYNLARNWAHFGSSSGGPTVGAIVVWPHHVGLITARNGSGWVIKSGNDGHAIRERERSLRGAIAFRWPSRTAAL